MKFQRIIRIVRNVWDIVHSKQGSAQDRDLNEYEKVKKEFKSVNTKRSKPLRDENRDVSAI